MKKKLLTLTFTLILLISLVAAMGMNASAATANIEISAATGVGDYDNLATYMDQLRPKTYFKLTRDIVVTNDSQNLSLPVDASGTFVLDLNGYDIIINSDKTTSVFNVGSYFSTEFHVINSNATRSQITLNSIADGASVFYINDERSSLHIYDNISINVAADGINYFYNPNERVITYGIRAGLFDTIAIHGADIYNRSAFGGGVLFTANVPGSKFIIDGDTEIISRFVGLNFSGIGSVAGYPDIQLKALHLAYDNAVPPVDDVSYSKVSSYTAIGGLGTTKTKDIIGSSMQAYYGTSEPYSRYFSNDSDLIKNLPTGNNLKIYSPSCGHYSGYECCLRLFVPNQSPLHFTICSYCAKKPTYNTCTFVTKQEATASADGHTAGYDCNCGNKTSETIHYLGVYTKKAATCTADGYKETMYYCKHCSNTFFAADKTTPVSASAFRNNRIPALDHTYKTVTTKATLTKNGKVESKCSCGKVSKTTTVYYPKTIRLSKTAYTYNGKVQTPSVSVKDSKGNTLKKDSDYTVKYESGRKSTGKYSVTITFKGKYSGTKTLYFNILPSKTSKITPTCSTTEIKATWNKVTGASGYKVELLNSKGKVVKKVTTTKTSYTFKKLSKVTTYKIRVTAYKTIDKKAAYSTVSTTITTSTAPAKVTLSKVTAGSKSATPAWKTVSGASGYEVQYSTSSKFKSAKTATVKKGSSKKTTIKKLTKGKKYYFKVRAYKTVDGKKVYGAWSAVKSVKVK